MLLKIKECFKQSKVFYTKHAKDEMIQEEFGEIRDKEIFEAILSGVIIESYPEDEPYPSCLIYGKTSENRHLHIVCAYSQDSDVVIIITVYQPDKNRWIDYERRKK